MIFCEIKPISYSIIILFDENQLLKPYELVQDFYGQFVLIGPNHTFVAAKPALMNLCKVLFPRDAAGEQVYTLPQWSFFPVEFAHTHTTPNKIQK